MTALLAFRSFAGWLDPNPTEYQQKSQIRVFSTERSDQNGPSTKNEIFPTVMVPIHTSQTFIPLTKRRFYPTVTSWSA